MEFLPLFLRRRLAGKPVIASPNVACFLRLEIKQYDAVFHSTIEMTQKRSMNSDDVNGWVSLRKQPTFRETTAGNPAKSRLPRSKHRNSVLMTRHYADLGGASDYLKQLDQSEKLPISRWWRVIIMEFSAFLRRHFAVKLVAELWNVGCSLRLLLAPKFEYARGGGVWKADLATN